MASATHLERRSTEISSVLFPRMVLSTLVFTAVLFPWLYEPYLSTFYGFLAQTSLYRFSGFETVETVIFYALVEALYTVKFVQNPGLRIDVRRPTNGADSRFDAGNPRRPRMRHPSRRLREAVTYVLPLFFLDFTLIKKYAGVSVTEIRRSGGYIPAHAGTGKDISTNFLSPTFHNFSLSSPLQLQRALPLEAPSSRRIILELITSLFIYDALFFLIHMAFHRIPYLASFHTPHHRHGEINPQITNQLSIAERLSLVLHANFSLNIIKSHVLTRTAFVPIFVYLLVDIHSGLDLEWSYDKVLPSGWGAGTKKHALHHREGNGQYEPFFCWWDRALQIIDNSRRTESRKSP